MAMFPSRASSRARTLILALSLSGVAASCGKNGALDPNNELPFGYLDLPAEGAMVPAGKPLQVAGWALDDSAVKEVRVYFDNKFKAKTSINVERPDLAKPYASYIHGTNLHGWNVQIDVPNAPGPHTILAQVVDDGGATRDVRPASIIVQ
jgi:hypothetical protein